MITAHGGELGWRRVAGDPRGLGRALGAAGRQAVADHLLPHPLWQQVTGPAHRPAVRRMAATVARRFPDILAEIEGLAEGLDLPFETVFAWTCRGDLLADTPEGCTTVMLPGPEPVLAHTEDGIPGLAGHCFIAEVRPDWGPGFHSFCYPGSIPGHTFGWSAAGLVMTVNNLRLTGLSPEVPRMVLTRAMLTAPDIDAALAILRAGAGSGGFHVTLGQCGDPRLVSVEFGGGAVSVREVTVPSAHANHALHHPAAAAEAQIVTRSSDDRQARAAALLVAGTGPVDILRDHGGAGRLPIWRDAPDDPDDENTMALARFRIGAAAIDWDIRDHRHSPPRYAGRQG
ncbi:MAG: C45 family peptidase [Rhodobacteraceae bacterium]|nr:C45 family peptidase [Paracoccaceae bacterium]